MRWALASLHLLALGIGLGAVWGRSRALRGPLDAGAVQRALTADVWWGIAALIWLATGLWRLFAGTEKATSYYMTSSWFLIKLGLFVLIVLMEVWPAATFARWRAARSRGDMPDTRSAGALANISAVQAALVVAIVGAAAAMARGY
jgi:putative membrane protein